MTTQLYIVAYDIPSDKRRTKLHKALCGFGEWTQFSLFECYLNERELVKLRARLDELLKPDEDQVRIYPLCAACAKAVETIGDPPPQEKSVYIA
jgi:CRISPR-associated protein Cas2